MYFIGKQHQIATPGTLSRHSRGIRKHVWLSIQDAQKAAAVASSAGSDRIAALRGRLEVVAAALRATVAATLCCCDALETSAARHSEATAAGPPSQVAPRTAYLHPGQSNEEHNTGSFTLAGVACPIQPSGSVPHEIGLWLILTLLTLAIRLEAFLISKGTSPAFVGFCMSESAFCCHKLKLLTAEHCRAL